MGHHLRFPSYTTDALQSAELSLNLPPSNGWKTYPEELPQTRVIWLARLPLCIFQILSEPEPQHLQHAVDRLVRGANGNKGVRRIEIVPVFEVGCRLEELRWKREAYGSEICDTNEPRSGNIRGQLTVSSYVCVLYRRPPRHCFGQ